MAVTLADVVLRRTDLGSAGRPAPGRWRPAPGSWRRNAAGTKPGASLKSPGSTPPPSTRPTARTTNKQRVVHHVAGFASDLTRSFRGGSKVSSRVPYIKEHGVHWSDHWFVCSKEPV